MDAQNLAYPDGTFDVVISRNLTWTLPDPQRAYASWFRVLKPGRVLLNFDANWYRYLWDEDAQAAHAQDRENLQASDVRDETAGTDVDAMEAIARKTPLSKLHRPAWDLDVLRGLGMQAAADTEVWKQVWTKEERINNASTPMFLVEGHKVGVPTFVSKLPATLLLTALSIGMTVVISVPLGVLAAVRHDRLTDYFLRFSAFWATACPASLWRCCSCRFSPFAYKMVNTIFSRAVRAGRRRRRDMYGLRFLAAMPLTA